MGMTNQSIVINAPADRVWKAIRDFHDLSWAPNVIQNVEAVGDASGGELGAKRVLNGMFHETLLTLDDAQRRLTYSIDDGPSPISSEDVSDYVGVVQVSAGEGGGTLVEWTSSWEKNDEAGYEFCHPIYVALLNDMKASLDQA